MMSSTHEEAKETQQSADYISCDNSSSKNQSEKTPKDDDLDFNNGSN